MYQSDLSNLFLNYHKDFKKDYFINIMGGKLIPINKNIAKASLKLGLEN